MSSSGIGDSVGAPPQLSPEQLAKTAATMLAKTTMHLVADTIDLNFFLLDEGVRKYQSPANTPLLSAPKLTVRMATTSEDQVDQRWQQVYENLVQNLPKEVAQLLTISLQLPPAQRGANLVVLDNLLQSTAQTLTWLGGASQVLDPESLAGVRAEENTLSPYVALGGSLQTSNVLLKSTLDMLSMLGPNYTHFNTISSYMSEFSQIATSMATAANILRQPENLEAGQRQFATLATDMANLASRFDSLASGSDLQLLSSLLHASAVINAAIGLESMGSAPLLMSLFMANLAFSDPKSDTSAVGGHLLASMQALSASMLEAFVHQDDTASKLMLENVINTALTAAVLYGAHYYQQEPIQGSDSQPEVRAERSFAYSLNLLLLDKMGLISGTAEQLVATSRLDARSEEHATIWLSTAMTLFLILSAAKPHDPASVEPLIHDHKETLVKGFDQMAAFVSEGLQNGSIRGNNWEHSQVYIQQALIALSHDDSASVLDALDSILQLNGSNLNLLVDDIGKLIDYAEATQRSLQAGAEEAAKNSTSFYSPA